MSHNIITGTAGPDGPPNFQGTNTHDQIFGFGGNDTIRGLGGLDQMHGGAGVDTVDYTYSIDRWWIDLLAERAENLSDGGVEVITSFENAWGGDGRDQIAGTDGANYLAGVDGNDSLYGRGGNDRLQGGSGHDWLYGDYGNDVLIGEGGSDLFVFRTPDTATDRIVGFDGAGAGLLDRISLSQIDAITGGVDQDFQFFGELTDAQGIAEGRGSLWVHDDSDSSVTIVHGNVDGDDTLELTIRIEDGATTAGDYTEVDFYL